MTRSPARALAAAAAGALALLAALVPAAGATTPIGCATGAPLGPAQGWTEFVAGSGQRGSESEGSVAYGGNLSGMTVGTRLSSGSSEPTLVIGGMGFGWFNLQKGSAYAPHVFGGVNFNGGGHLLATNPVDFSAAFDDLRTRSAGWAAVAANGTAAVVNSDVTGTSLGGNVLWLRGSNAQINVFSVTPAQLTGIRATFIDVPAGATALINVSGTNVTVNGEVRYRSGSTYRQPDDAPVADAVARTIWNFAGATSVKLSTGSAFGGTILAPDATVEAVSVGHNNGQVIAASFKSNFETHHFPFPSGGCVPGGSTPPPGPASADVAITKTASDATPKGGDLVTYTLAVRNNGPDTAKNVVVTDPVPPGVTFSSASAPCTQAAGVVTCAIGDLASGATKTLTVKVTADPIAAVGTVPHPGATHLLPVTKVEQQVDLESGDTKTVALACPAGGVLTDASIRTDAVDQGTGALTDVRVLSAHTTGASAWEAVVRNDADGRAQAKGFAVCLPASTESADGHSHALTVSDPVAVTQALAPGARSATVSCPAGTTPIVPGFAFDGGSAAVTGSEPVSGGWRFDLAVDAATTATLSVRCLDTAVAAADGHTHDLKLTHVVEHVSVPAGQVVEGQVICPDDAKGIVGTWSLPPGVWSLGNDPRPKTRAYKLINAGAAPATATIDLECVGDRTGAERAAGPKPKPIVNTATAASDTSDPDPSNNSSSATITVTGGGPALMGATAKLTSSRVLLRAACPAGGRTCAGTAVVAKRSKVVARAGFRVKPGHAKLLRLKVSRAGRRALHGKRHRVRATLKLRGSRNVVKALTLKR